MLAAPMQAGQAILHAQHQGLGPLSGQQGVPGLPLPPGQAQPQWVGAETTDELIATALGEVGSVAEVRAPRTPLGPRDRRTG